MNTIVAILIAALPKIFIGIAAKLLSEQFMRVMVEDALIFVLRKGAKLSVTLYDDDMVEKMAKQIKGVVIDELNEGSRDVAG